MGVNFLSENKQSKKQENSKRINQRKNIKKIKIR